MHFKKSVLKNHLLYSIITLMAIAMLFPITAFAQVMYKHGILLIRKRSIGGTLVDLPIFLDN